ncbi:hypothetical protein CHS0354_017257 [Potamilus streckersoni]|uniref:Uncharacterized protein n=1 Tax=Potamilus streckersoni TaxID=2493646 RepID=A0AAE0RZE8_9BIVA|nr:hypothetical protein CHS0354_017257 [Potamilus streckersoni]
MMQYTQLDTALKDFMESICEAARTMKVNENYIDKKNSFKDTWYYADYKEAKHRTLDVLRNFINANMTISLALSKHYRIVQKIITSYKHKLYRTKKKQHFYLI